MGISQAEFEYNENYGCTKINHPDYYNLPSKKECIEQMLEDYGGRITATFCLTNAYKYLYRAGNKESSSYENDIEKARWYFNFVQDRVSSYIQGKKAVKLYLYVKRKLENL